LRVSLETTINNALNADSSLKEDCIQTLWSGYGEIVRYRLKGAKMETIIAKHVKVPDQMEHPRGWNNDISQQRKIHSYHIEAHWYRHWVSRCNTLCRAPKPYYIGTENDCFIFLLEDLDAAGFSRRVTQATQTDIEACLSWLANFHATFLGVNPNTPSATALWPTGTYWHLATRQCELDALDTGQLKSMASLIDLTLSKGHYTTIVHGDAKIANFCFSESSDNVAALDFQYVGGGCGMKDVMLLLSSCLTSEECELHAPQYLSYYFSQLDIALSEKLTSDDFKALEREWRAMYAITWADFVRFLSGWSPGHWKIHKYSEHQTQLAINYLNTEREA